MSAAALDTRMYTSDIREVFRNPLAFGGGITGTMFVGFVFVVLAFLFGDSCERRLRASWQAQGQQVWSEEFAAALEEACYEGDAACIDGLRRKWLRDSQVVYSLPYGFALGEACPPEEEEEFSVDFDPGTIMKLGEIREEPEIPIKEIVAETRTEDPVAEVVTEEEKPEPPKKKEKKPDPEPKDKKLPKSKVPRNKKNDFGELPTVDQERGNPFGSATGWSDMQKDGDPWATAVMEALNNMPVGAYGARMQQGNFKFQLSLCKNGKIQQVTKKGGSLPADLQAAIVLALDQTKLPKPPPSVVASMSSDCARLRYTFEWSTNGVE